MEQRWLRYQAQVIGLGTQTEMQPGSPRDLEEFSRIPLPARNWLCLGMPRSSFGSSSGWEAVLLVDWLRVVKEHQATIFLASVCK